MYIPRKWTQRDQWGFACYSFALGASLISTIVVSPWFFIAVIFTGFAVTAGFVTWYDRG